MMAGERGADYVMFGEPETDGSRPSFGAILERVGWWAELFEVPCVAYAANPDEVGLLAAAGADFVAVGSGIWDDPRGPAVAAAEAGGRPAVREGECLNEWRSQSLADGSRRAGRGAAVAGRSRTAQACATTQASTAEYCRRTRRRYRRARRGL